MTSKAESVDFTCKVLIIGNAKVGKSCILLKYTQNTFNVNLPSTVGIDFKTKIVDQNGSKVKMQLWDTAGQERFRPIIQTFYKNTKASVIAFDLSDYQSLKDVSYWIDQLYTNCSPNLPKIIIGNKYDLIFDSDKNKILSQYQETYTEINKEIKEIQKQYPGIQYFECSAKTGHNINEAFEGLVQEVIKQYDIENGSDDSDNTDNENATEKQNNQSQIQQNTRKKTKSTNSRFSLVEDDENKNQNQSDNVQTFKKNPKKKQKSGCC